MLINMGKTIIQKGRKDAEHPGVKSVVKGLRSHDFIRIRVGIDSHYAENNDRKFPDFDGCPD